MANLTRQTAQAVTLTQLESIRFSTDAIAVFHKLMGDKFKKYLRSGNEEELGDFAKMNIKDYKGFINLFMQLTGQDPDKKPQLAEITHKHEMVETKKEAIDVTPTSILDMLENGS
jgi:hypothetical protein